MIKKFLCAATAAMLFANGAMADVVYVLRPPTVPSAAKVLPQNAFSSGNTEPSDGGSDNSGSGNTGAGSGATLFKSWDYDQTTWAPETASLSVSAGNIFKFQPPGLAGKTCMVVAKEKKVYRSNPDPSSFLVLDGFGKFFVKMTGIGTVYLSVACWSDPRQLDLLPVKFAITGTP